MIRAWTHWPSSVMVTTLGGQFKRRWEPAHGGIHVPRGVTAHREKEVQLGDFGRSRELGCIGTSRLASPNMLC